MNTFDTLIDVDTLAAALGRPGWRVVDCRFDLFDAEKGPADHAAGHIPGAVFAHLDDDLAAPVTATTGRHPLPTAAEFAATLERLGISNDTQVVAYDGGPGGLAARLWWMLRWVGHEAVAVLDGGYAAWLAAGGAVETGRVEVPRGRFTPEERAGWVLSTAELASRLAEGEAPLLVDAREAPRYRGEAEPIDSEAGHVPGAVNRPFAANLGGDGRWRDAPALAADWQALFGGEPPTEWAVMCGSGVTACHLALAAAHAGVSPPPRLYAGSWSEWIRDPARPRSR